MDADDPVEGVVPPRTLLVTSTKAGLVGSCTVSLLLSSITTTSDMVGLEATDDWVHMRAMSITFFNSPVVHSFRFNFSSTKSINMSFSCRFHA